MKKLISTIALTAFMSSASAANLQSQYQLTPDLSEQTQQLGAALGKLRERRQERREQQKLVALRRTAAGLGDTTLEQQHEAILQLLAEDPVAARQFLDALNALPKMEKK